ncbi:MAG TPA: DUF6691 family protein [Polyangiaceae bacterium]|nr:DUF6691 family protein [Polyangiaceae bacterium]
MSALFHVILGTAFGWVLSRSGAADYDYIQAMFRFQSFQLYGILGVAVLVTAPGLLLLKRRARTLLGSPLEVPAKPFHRGNFIGGALFGIGWSITGMCPGPIVVNLGEGKLYAIAALAGALLGSSLFAISYPRLQTPLGLPKLESGAGDG